MGVPDLGNFFVVLFWLAVVGMVAIACGGVWLLWFLFTHVTIGWA